MGLATLPEAVADFGARFGSGLLCLPIITRRLDELAIGPMVERNTSRLGTAFSVSIDATGTTTTGASAFDRAATIRKVLDRSARSSDFSVPSRSESKSPRTRATKLGHLV
jgi:3,4-dihydroxy 2-butanone 4-phosphate synthase/GTP cyclohydrolase II